MHRQRDAAVGTIERRAALAAEHRGRESSPVEQQQRLFAPLETLREGGHERRAQNDVGTFGCQHLPHVDHAYVGERPIQHTPLQRDELVAAVERMTIALHRRRRRAEHHQGTGLPPAHDGQVTAVVARRLLLLVRRVVLLVDDDQAELSSGEKTADRVPTTMSMSPRGCDATGRGARRPRGRCAAPPRASPNTSRNTRRDGRRQRNLRHQHQHLPAARATSAASRRYSSVLPLPVTPCSSATWNAPPRPACSNGRTRPPVRL